MKKLLTKMVVCSYIIASLSTGIVGGATSFSLNKSKEISNMADIEKLESKAALLMELETGRVLFEKNLEEKLPIASITKVMTLLLIFEELDKKNISLSDIVTTSSYANEMGGSQIYLAIGEKMTVQDLLKSLAVSSANDAAVALAEHTFGSVGVFVQKMNQKAKELNLQHTLYSDVTGLNDENYSSAYDIAIAARELLTQHPMVKEYTGIWVDSIRDGEFDLYNTNKLLNHYTGTNGLKTGFTSKAGNCLVSTVKRGEIELIAVVLGASDTNYRFGESMKILDHGYANFNHQKILEKGTKVPEAKVENGKVKLVGVEVKEDFTTLVNINTVDKINKKIVLNEKIIAPINQGDKLGSVVMSIHGEELGAIDLVASEDVEKAAWYVRLYRWIISLFGYN